MTGCYCAIAQIVPFIGEIETLQRPAASGAAELARPMLEGLIEDVEKHALEVWDPALCVDLYRMLIQAIRAENGANVDRSQREAVLFEKLCRLDPRTALVLARR